MNQCTPCKRVIQAIARSLAQLDAATGSDPTKVMQYVRVNSKFETLPQKVFTNIFIELIQISDVVREVIVRITRVLGDFMEDTVEHIVRLEWHDGRWRRISPCY